MVRSMVLRPCRRRRREGITNGAPTAIPPLQPGGHPVHSRHSLARVPRPRKEAPTMSQPRSTGNALRLEVLDGSISLLTLDQPNSRANTLGQAILGELEGKIGRASCRE